MSAEEIERTTRMSAAQRREQILAAASRAFAQSGYAGTSTDAVAREAGVSQPYVVRMFGSKADLFREVFQRAIDAILATFTAELDRIDADPEPPEVESEEYWERLGAVYGELLTDRNILLVLMHGFVAGSAPEIGAQARAGMSKIYELIRRRTNCTPERAREFFAQGMLLNTLLAMQAPEHAAEDPALLELCNCSFGPILPMVTAAGAAQLAGGAPTR
jgi:AcrR family transcriptional regulator